MEEVERTETRHYETDGQTRDPELNFLEGEPGFSVGKSNLLVQSKNDRPKGE